MKEFSESSLASEVNIKLKQMKNYKKGIAKPKAKGNLFAGIKKTFKESKPITKRIRKIKQQSNILKNHIKFYLVQETGLLLEGNMHLASLMSRISLILGIQKAASK